MVRQRVIEPPPWPVRDVRARVLVESRDPALRHAVKVALGDDYVVVDCGGPDPGEVCPAVEHGHCPTAAHADVVVCDFRSSDEHSRALPAAVAGELRDGASVIVQVARPTAERHDETLAGTTLLYHPVRRDELRRAVTDAVARLDATPRRGVHGPRLAWSPPRLDPDPR